VNTKQSSGEYLTFPGSVEMFFLPGIPTNFRLMREGSKVKLVCDYIPGEELPYIVWVRKVGDKFRRKFRLKLRDHRAFMSGKKRFYSGVRLPKLILNDEVYDIIVYAFDGLTRTKIA